MRTLRLNLKGSDIKVWQAFLHSAALYEGKLDGAFGPATLAATKAFQRVHRLSDDGVVGNGTLGLAMQLGLQVLPDDVQSTNSSIRDAWTPPPPPTDSQPILTPDPRVILGHEIGQLPCPTNPPPPVGWSYWKGKVSTAQGAFAVDVEFHSAKFPMGSFVQALIEEQLVGARVEWHDFQGATGKRGCFRGTSLFHSTLIT